MPFENLFINYLKSDRRYFFAVCITVIFSICVHELCHGIVAIALGDRTPIERGHMTMNPMKHMGGMSLILLLMAGIAWGAMPVNPSRLRGRHARALVAAAGPISNVLMATIALSALGLWDRFGADVDLSPVQHNIHYFLFVFGVVNISLAIFNVLPIPPLDGSNILADLSADFAQFIQRMRQGGQLNIAFLLIFFFAGRYIEIAAIRSAFWFLTLVRGS